MNPMLEEIWMYGNFTAENALKLRKQLLEHATMGPDFPIVIYINSYGGNVDALNSILDTLDSLPNPIVTICAGTAMSAGAVLLSYGDERYIGKNSRVMLHQVSSGVFGTSKEIQTTEKEISRLNQQLMKVLSKTTGKSLTKIKELFNDNVDKYLTSAEAIKFGIVDKVGAPRLIRTVSYELVE